MNRYTIKNIRRGRKEQGRQHIIYAELYNEKDELIIAATLEYIYDRIQDITLNESNYSSGLDFIDKIS